MITKVFRSEFIKTSFTSDKQTEEAYVKILVNETSWISWLSCVWTVNRVFLSSSDSLPLLTSVLQDRCCVVTMAPKISESPSISCVSHTFTACCCCSLLFQRNFQFPLATASCPPPTTPTPNWHGVWITEITRWKAAGCRWGLCSGSTVSPHKRSLNFFWLLCSSVSNCPHANFSDI